jgi:DNA-3-methyladenine glycosylase I
MKRCSWCESSDIDRHYHDTEWGVPVYDDRLLFEMLILEGAQAGVSWHVVLSKRPHYKKVFADFNAVKLSKFTDAKLEKLLLDPGIIRNRLKVSEKARLQVYWYHHLLCVHAGRGNGK